MLTYDSRVISCSLTFAGVVFFGLPAAGDLAGDLVGACFPDYPGCVLDPTPALNAPNFTIDRTLAIVGDDVEFIGESTLVPLDFLVDFETNSPAGPSILLTIRNTGIISVTTSNPDFGWVFTGIDDPIDRVISLGGALDTTALLLAPGTIGFNYAPFSIPAVSPGFKAALFQIDFAVEAEPPLVSACVVNYPSCVADPSPGINEGGLLNTGIALVEGSEAEFSWVSATGNTTFFADLNWQGQPETGELLVTIRNNAIATVTSDRTDLGWVFAGIEKPISSIVRLGGDLGATATLLAPDTIGINFDPFSIPALGRDFKEALFQLNFGASEFCSTPDVDEDGDDNSNCEQTETCDSTDSDCKIDYVAMGDSYSSGEGNREYIEGTNFINSEVDFNLCHRSEDAYSYLIDFPIDAPNRVHISENTFIACSGAISDNLLSGGPSPDAAIYNENPQLDIIFPSSPIKVVNASTDLITLTVSGNDIDFPGVLQTCHFDPNCQDVEPQFLLGPADLVSEIDANIAQVRGKVKTVLSQIKSKAPYASIFLAGYPHLFEVGKTCFGFNAAEVNMLRLKSIQLNAEIKEAAKEEGVHYVDMISPDRFKNHGICSASSWITGFYSSADTSEWAHPTDFGHVSYSVGFEIGINLTPGPMLPSGLPQNPVGINPIVGTPLAQQSTVVTPPLKIGKLSVTRETPLGCDSGFHFVPNELIRLTGAGFAPSSAVIIRTSTRDETFTSEIGTFTIDSNGDLDQVVTLPAGIPANEEAGISAIGTKPDGGAFVLLDYMFIYSSTLTDTDFDTIPDVCDSCPDDPDGTNADTDGDDIGDACDPCPNDASNDSDYDGLCADVDPCPLDPDNDLDGDGLCADVEPDSDGDGIIDIVPEPGVFLQLVAGGIGLALLNRRRMRKNWRAEPASGESPLT